MFQLLKTVKLNSWIIAGVLLVVFVGIIVSLTGAGRRGSESSNSVVKADDSTDSPVINRVRANETPKLGIESGKLSMFDSASTTDSPTNSVQVNVRQAVTLWNAAGSEFESNLLEAMGGAAGHSTTRGRQVGISAVAQQREKPSAAN